MVPSGCGRRVNKVRHGRRGAHGLGDHQLWVQHIELVLRDLCHIVEVLLKDTNQSPHKTHFCIAPPPIPTRPMPCSPPTHSAE